jgi:hypothetical protein
MKRILMEIVNGERSDKTAELFGSTKILVDDKGYRILNPVRETPTAYCIDLEEFFIPLIKDYREDNLYVYNGNKLRIHYRPEREIIIISGDKNIRSTTLPEFVEQNLKAFDADGIFAMILPGNTKDQIEKYRGNFEEGYAKVNNHTKTFETHVKLINDHTVYREVPFIEGIYEVKVPSKYYNTDILSSLSIHDLPDDVEVREKIKNDVLPLTKEKVTHLSYSGFFFRVQSKSVKVIFAVTDKHIEYYRGPASYETMYMVYYSAKNAEEIETLLNL